MTTLEIIEELVSRYPNTMRTIAVTEQHPFVVEHSDLHQALLQGGLAKPDDKAQPLIHERLIRMVPTPELIKYREHVENLLAVVWS